MTFHNNSRPAPAKPGPTAAEVMQMIADAIAAYGAAQVLIQRGNDFLPFSNTVATSKTVNFPQAFSGRPEVTITPYGTSVYFATLGQTPAPGSFVAQMRRYDSVAATVNIPFSWIAIGPR